MSDAIYKPLIEDMTWSWSRIETFKNCPYEWFLKYIRGETEQPRFYSSYGSFMHSLLERYYTGFLPAKELPLEFLTNFAEEVEGFRPSDTVVGNYVDQGLSYFKNFHPFQLNTVAVEEKFAMDIGGVRFTGIIDYIGERDGEYYIIDHKSADLKPRSNRKKQTKSDMELSEKLRQLYIYSAFLKEKYGKYPKSLCFNCFRTGTFIEEPFDEEAYKEAVEYISSAVKEIAEEENFNPNVSFFYCKYLCGYSDDCCYWKLRGGN